MPFAPLAPALNAMLSGLPFAIAQKLDPGAVHQQVQRPINAPVGYRDGQDFSPATQGREVGHCPVEARHLQQAGHHPCHLSQRQLEHNLDGQAELYRRIREHRRTTRATIMRR